MNDFEPCPHCKCSKIGTRMRTIRNTHFRNGKPTVRLVRAYAYCKNCNSRGPLVSSYCHAEGVNLSTLVSSPTWVYLPSEALQRAEDAWNRRTV